MTELTHETKRAEEQSYDEVPYDSNSFSHTHPRHLYTIAKLFNLNPPDFRKCRVLELGCASGGNLFPQAQQYPDSEFVGIDISGEQISKAKQDLKKLKFSNLTFLQEDITKITKDLGSFDYIISHGVLSWIPPEVQKKLFEVYANNLSENGIGFISYNTLPGWNMVRSVRDIMMFHARRFKKPEDQIVQSRALLDFLSENLNEKDPYRAVIDNERKMLAQSNNYYIFHDHLEIENHQFYLHEFAQTASNHKLQYVGDTKVSSMYIGNMPKSSIKELSSIGGDIVMQEQYMDFLKNRRFRNSILTHKNIKINRQIKAERIFDFLVSANFYKHEKKSTKERVFFCLIRDGNDMVSFDDPLMIKIFTKLCEHNIRPVYLKNIIKNTCKNKQDEERVRAMILQLGIEMVMKGFLFLHSDEGCFTSTISKKPIANPWARYQAAQQDCYTITNSLGERMRIDKVASFILKNLDGNNDIKSLTLMLADHIEKGDLDLNIENLKDKNAKEITESIKISIQKILKYFAKNAILIE